MILTLVGMALSGYTQSRDSHLWKINSMKASSLLTDPYLEAALLFLSDDEDGFQSVLETNITLADKIAFACRYLPDKLVLIFCIYLFISYMSF